MFAITGITGQVGTKVAEGLLSAGKPVRAIVRNAGKGAVWRERGCEVAVVEDAADDVALAVALKGVTGAFLVNPPNYDPEPGFPDTHRTAASYTRAILKARPGCVVALSSVGAQVPRFNLLNNAGILEQALAGTGVPTAFLRPAWFIENVQWDIASAREGRIESFLQPPDRAIDMVSVRDVGQVAAALLCEEWQGARVVELKGPRSVSPADLAAGLAEILGHSVEVAAVPCDEWEARFCEQGMRNPAARIAMLKGFNEGWLEFGYGDAEQRAGVTDARVVLAALAGRAPD